jgi:hypothetical protein
VDDRLFGAPGTEDLIIVRGNPVDGRRYRKVRWYPGLGFAQDFDDRSTIASGSREYFLALSAPDNQYPHSKKKLRSN